MRRFLAILLLFAIGLSAPAAAGDGVICLAALVKAAVIETDCCHDCHGKPEQRDPCCLELKQLPDAQLRESSPPLPDMPVIDLSWLHSLHALEPVISGERLISGRCDPPRTCARCRRSVLQNWRL